MRRMICILLAACLLFAGCATVQPLQSSGTESQTSRQESFGEQEESKPPPAIDSEAEISPASQYGDISPYTLENLAFINGEGQVLTLFMSRQEVEAVIGEGEEWEPKEFDGTMYTIVAYTHPHMNKVVVYDGDLAAAIMLSTSHSEAPSFHEGWRTADGLALGDSADRYLEVYPNRGISIYRDGDVFREMPRELPAENTFSEDVPFKNCYSLGGSNTVGDAIDYLVIATQPAAIVLA